MSGRKIDSWFLGIDLGTGSCKSVVVDEQGRVLGFGSSEYASDSTSEKWQEQDPNAVLNGMVLAARNAIQNAGELPGSCAGLSIGGALHSLMAVDAAGKPLTGVMTWADARATPQAKALSQITDIATLYQQTGCPAHGMYPLYKICWLKDERPEIFQKAARFISAKEFVFSQLTNHFVVDYSVAAGSGLLNVHHLEWNPQSLDLAGISPSQLSTLADPRETFVGIQPDLARRMGLSPKTRVVLGSSDAANSTLGAGSVSMQQATCMVGTSAALRIIASQPILDPLGRSWCYAIDREHWLVGGSINNGGIVLSWLRDSLNRFSHDSTSEQQLSFAGLLEMASQIPLGAQGLICLPFFAGERSPNWNLDSRAVFFGLGLEHDARHIARALLEGITFRLMSLKEILDEISWNINEIRASGGFTHSRFWLQLVTDALDCELVVPSWGETSSLGAAFWALMATGAIQNLEAIHARVSVQDHLQPGATESQAYRLLYRFYKDLYRAVSPSFRGLAELKESLKEGILNG